MIGLHQIIPEKEVTKAEEVVVGPQEANTDIFNNCVPILKINLLLQLQKNQFQALWYLKSINQLQYDPYLTEERLLHKFKQNSKLTYCNILLHHRSCL